MARTSLRVRPSTFWLRYCELKLARRLAGILDSRGPEPACGHTMSQRHTRPHDTLLFIPVLLRGTGFTSQH